LPAAGELGPPRVLDILPGAIWVQYGIVRAHETVREPTTAVLHALRIEIKRLRYILEFFRSALGARIVPAIEAAVAAQDRLGHLQDLCVAAELLQSWLHTLGPAQPADARSAAAYLATLYEEIQTNLNEGSKLWEELTALPFRRRIARLVERL
jgi:CHAD domain-containing protein